MSQGLIVSCLATTVAGSAALPFVISTEAKRSGEIRGRPFLELPSRSTTALPLSSRPKRSVVERSAVSVCSHADSSAPAYRRSFRADALRWVLAHAVAGWRPLPLVPARFQRAIRF